MPKASVNENHGAVSLQHYVRASGQCPIVKPVPEAIGVKELAHQQFWTCVLRPNRLHVLTALN
jgi:hypothetical protein